MKKDKCLVTGGAGFIGSHVVNSLIDQSCDVVVLDDLSGGFVENVNLKAEFVKGSILDHELIDDLCKKHKFDYIFHLAAYAAEGLSHFIKRFNYNNNLIGSINLINAAINNNVKNFIFTSSVAVYGGNQVPMDESMTPSPEDSYGVSKFAVELELAASKEMFGLNYVIFRPHNVYGEYQNIGDKYRNVIGIFMNQIMQGDSLTIFGDGEQTRAFSYIGDMAPIIASSRNCEKAYGEVFNIGADKPYSVNELVRVVAEAMGSEVEVTHLNARNEVVDAYSSHEKIAKFFDLPEETTLAEGISKMAKWAKEVGSRSSQEFGDIEVRKNLPPSWA